MPERRLRLARQEASDCSWKGMSPCSWLAAVCLPLKVMPSKTTYHVLYPNTNSRLSHGNWYIDNKMKCLSRLKKELPPASAFDARMTALKCVSSARNVTVFSRKQMRGRERLHIEEQCVCHRPDSSALCSSEWYWLRHQASSLISSGILQQYRGREEQRKTLRAR